ncbi:MFS transporter [Cellulomonas sp. SG140]|uniref:MFS transporter n=1 Tax=Cellulomonas sp. SG140 TaxID=2976536 RepID=UPI0021E845B6|nr:MFS transporter [Cellulomonas sp. SG140]
MAGTTGHRRRWLTRNLVVLTLVSLFQDTASELLYPLLPVLVTGVLAAPPVVLGVIEGVAEGTAGLARYVTGRWSDRAGRVRFIGAGYGLAAVGKVLVAAAGAWPTVLAGRTVDRLGKGVRSAPRDALIAASVPSENLGRAFGFHRAGDTLGAVVGPLLGLLALSVMGGNLHAALWWAVVPAVLSAGLVVLVREHRAPAPAPARRGPAPAGPAPLPARPVAASAAPSRPLPAAYWWVVGVLVVVALVNFSDTLLLLRVSELGFGTTQVVLAYVLFNVVYAVGSYPAGALTDRWPRAYVYAVGLLAFAIGYVGLALVGKGPAVFVLLAVYGLFPALTDGVGKAWISSLVPAEHRGRAQGAFQALSSGAVLVAGLWAGLLWDAGRGRGTVPLLVSGAGAVIAVPVLAALRFRARPRP